MPHECEPSSAALLKSDQRAGPGFRVGGFAAPRPISFIGEPGK